MAGINLNLTRRKFMIAGSAAVAAPLLSNLPGAGMVPEAKAALQGPVYFIGRTCIGCQVCRMFCPAEAIHFGDLRNEIDQDKCEHCGTCYEECPISAISETEI